MNKKQKIQTNAGFAHMVLLLIVLGVLIIGFVFLKSSNNTFSKAKSFFLAQIYPGTYGSITAPSELNISVLAAGFKLTWKDNSSNPNEARFELHRFTQAPLAPYQVSSATHVANVSANVITYTDNGSIISNPAATFTSGTTYYYAVRAVDTYGRTSGWSNVVQGKYTVQPTLGATSGTYNGITFQVTTDRKVALNWKAAFPGTFTEFRVRRIISKRYHPYSPIDPGTIVKTQSGTAYTYTDSPKLAGIFVYEIRAKNSRGVYTTKNIEIAVNLTTTEIEQLSAVKLKLTQAIFGKKAASTVAQSTSRKSTFSSLFSTAHAQIPGSGSAGPGEPLEPYIMMATMMADNFDAIDTNDDGVISNAEMTAYLSALAQAYMNSVEIPFGALIKTDIINNFKKQNEGLGMAGQIAQINAMYKALIAAYKAGLAGMPNMLGGQANSQSALNELLDLIDTNNDGIISPEERDAYWNKYPGSLGEDTKALNEAYNKFLDEVKKKIPVLASDASCFLSPTSAPVGIEVTWSLQSATFAKFLSEHNVTWQGSEGLSNPPGVASQMYIVKKYNTPGTKYAQVTSIHKATGFKLRRPCPELNVYSAFQIILGHPTGGSFPEKQNIEIRWAGSGVSPEIMNSTNVQVTIIKSTETGELSTAATLSGTISSGKAVWSSPPKGIYKVQLKTEVLGNNHSLQGGWFQVVAAQSQ